MPNPFQQGVTSVNRQFGINPWGTASQSVLGQTQPQNQGITQQTDLLNQLTGFGQQLLDPNSQFFAQYANLLGRANPVPGQNALLAPLLAGGASFGGSQVIAGQQREDLLKDRTEAINTGVQSFASGAVGAGLGAISQAQSQAQQQDQFFAGLNLQSQMFNAQNEAGVFDYLSLLVPGLSLIPGIGGGGASGGGR